MFRKLPHLPGGASLIYLNGLAKKSRAMGQNHKFSVTGGSSLSTTFRPRNGYSTMWEMLLYNGTRCNVNRRKRALTALKRARGDELKLNLKGCELEQNRKWKGRYGSPGKGKGRRSVVTVDAQDLGTASTVCVAVVDEDTCQAQENIQGGTRQGKHLRSWGVGEGVERECVQISEMKLVKRVSLGMALGKRQK